MSPEGTVLAYIPGPIMLLLLRIVPHSPAQATQVQATGAISCHLSTYEPLRLLLLSTNSLNKLLKHVQREILTSNATIYPMKYASFK